MKDPELFTRTVRRAWHGLRLVPRFWRLRRKKRAAPPKRPQSPYRRYYTRDHSFAELVGPKGAGAARKARRR